MNTTLGGAVCVRNGNDLDYCWKEAVQSLLPVCDEVVLCIATGNSDATEAEARAWAHIEPKLKICIYAWPDPVADLDFWVNWLNYAREHIRADWHFQLDADEILADWSYPLLRAFVKEQSTMRRPATGIVTRYNFWRDHRHLIPEGNCLAKRVIRLAPRDLWLGSDCPHPKAREAQDRSVSVSEITPEYTLRDIEIFHYGFLRRHEALLNKGRANGQFFFGAVDSRIETAAKEGANWSQSACLPDWTRNLDKYEGKHPAIGMKWLNQRGYHD